MKAEFGWVLPTGNQRMPSWSDYTSHIDQVVGGLRGSFHSLWIPDHFMSGHGPIPEALVTLSFIAGLYSDFHVGTAVLAHSYRNPALLAKMAASLQALSKGRFILGLGAGWKEVEYLAYGYPFPPAPVRIEQLAETVQICRAMWDPDAPEATFIGRHYRIDGARCFPKPTPPPPIMIGGGGEQLTLRVVAQRADWWNLPGATPEKFARKLGILERYCDEVERTFSEIRKTWMGVVSIARSRFEAEQRMDGYPIWPGDVPLLGTPADVRDQIYRYRELGVDLFILSFADEPDMTGMELFVRDVVSVFV